ncbi:hypothetical protein ACCO45_001204 [Purpureocillium lilacinum]|uniref:Uncharacterized protein n=1 Tax=Purpureocillium lilacinum TaxID=33203 RepID=A0ACC4E6B8_PURLI
MPLPVVWQVAATGIVETVAVVSWVPDGAAEAETSNSSLARVSAERRHRRGGGGGGANSGLMQKRLQANDSRTWPDPEAN